MKGNTEMKMREIKKTVSGRQTRDGAGVRLTRVISQPDVYDFDPFLMLDAFDSTDPQDYIRGFPWHPHRGIETVTYLIYGDIEHGDSLGNSGSIRDGCCQWMTAGSGIIHQEMPKASEYMLGVQLWLNLPAHDKMAQPKYHDIRPENIALIQEKDYSVKVLSGNLSNVPGAMQGDYVKADILDVTVFPQGGFSMKTDPSDTVFAYILKGNGSFGTTGEMIPAKQVVLFETGEFFLATAGEIGLRFLLFAGRPLRETIAWGGPIVMNTQEELNTAFRELDEGTFIK